MNYQGLYTFLFGRLRTWQNQYMNGNGKNHQPITKRYNSMAGTSWIDIEKDNGVHQPADDGIEYSACLHEPTPDEVLELKERFCRLWNALNSLPEIQGRRVDAHFILGMTYREIAQAEGVDKSSVRESVLGGFCDMIPFL